MPPDRKARRTRLSDGALTQTKTEMRKENNQLIREALVELVGRAPRLKDIRDQCFGHEHHALCSAQLSVGATNVLDAGRYFSFVCNQ